MPTRDQLINALRQADAAGDEIAANRFAELIKAMPKQDSPEQLSAPSAQTAATPQATSQDPRLARTEAKFQELVGLGVPEGVARREAERLGYDSSRAPDFITGDSRKTELTESLPELQNSGLLAGESLAKTTALAPILTTTTNPDEIAKIITSNFPNVGVTYNKDGEGNVFPVLVNNETGAATIINKPGLSGMDALQGIGIGAAYTPAGKATTIGGAALKAGLTESAIQGSQAASGGDFNIEDVALSAGLGAGGKSLEEGVSTAARLARGSAKNELVDAGNDAGVRVLTSDVLPPKTFAGKQLQETGEKIPFAGTGPIRQQQQMMRERAVNDVAERYSEYSYDAIVESLTNTKNKIKSAAGNVLGSVGRKMDDIGEIDITNTKAAIQQAKSALDKRGVIRNQGAIDDIEALISTIDEAPQTFTTMKENRTAFREIVNSFDPTTKSQLGTRAKSLLQSVETGITADMRKMAKRNLSLPEFNKWQKANSIYADEARKLTKTKLKNILDTGDIAPEKVKGMLFSKTPSETKILYDSLDQKGKNHAKSALISKVVDDLTNNRISGLTPSTFETSMRKINPQIDTFFKGEEKKQLMGLMDVLRETNRAQSASVTTPTGQALAGGGFAFGLATNPIETLTASGTIAGLTRLYESPVVRNSLLRLRSSPRGSAQYDQALKEAAETLTTTAQTMREREQAE